MIKVRLNSNLEAIRKEKVRKRKIPLCRINKQISLLMRNGRLDILA